MHDGANVGPYVENGFAHLPIPPRSRLLIVGGGHVGQAVAALAADSDFGDTVAADQGTRLELLEAGPGGTEVEVFARARDRFDDVDGLDSTVGDTINLIERIMKEQAA